MALFKDETVTVNLDGHADTIQALRDMKSSLATRYVRTALDKAGELFYGLILQYVPYKTGKLARNIRVMTSRAGDFIRARVVINKVGKASNPLNAFYWRFLEDGFHDRGGNFVDHPFIAPAVYAHQQQGAQLVVDAVHEAIEKKGK